MSDSRKHRAKVWLIGLALPVLLLATACLDLTDPYVYVAPDLTGSGDFPSGPAPIWSGTRVRVATFNLERFFDTNCDSGRCNPGDFEAVLTEAEFNARADEIAAAIRDFNADIVLVQEIENQNCMDALFVRLADEFNDSRLGGTANPGSIDVGALIRGRVLEEFRHADGTIPNPGGGTTRFTREFLELHIALSRSAEDADRVEVAVFVGHFKSKASDDPDRRLAEAQAAHEIIVDTINRLDEELVVFGGDLNDTPGSPPLDALEDSGELLRVASDIPPADQATFDTQAIDHIFLGVRTGGTYVRQSATVFRDDRGGWGGSDHGALVAEFNFDHEDLIND